MNITEIIQTQFGCSWKELQLRLEGNDNPDALALTIGQQLNIDTTPVGDEKYLLPTELLTLRLLQQGLVGYLGHLVAPADQCLELAFKQRDKELVLYYLWRRAPISARIWQLSLAWGSWSVHALLLCYSSIDFTTCCRDICSNIDFLERLIDRYQIGRNLTQLNWLLRLIGSRLSLDDIDKLELPKVQLRECLKGMATAGLPGTLEQTLQLDKMQAALDRWKLPLTPYLAGLTGRLGLYQAWLPEALRNLETQPLLEGPAPATGKAPTMTVNGQVLQGNIVPVKPQIVVVRRQATTTATAELTDHAIQVLAGMAEVTKRVPKAFAAKVEAHMDHFSMPSGTTRQGHHTICWYRQVAEQGQLTEAEAARAKVEYLGRHGNFELRLNAALAEANLELLVLLESEQQLDYSYLLSKANSPLIAEWIFSRIRELNLNPGQVYKGLDLDQTDPYYNPTVVVYQKVASYYQTF